jgi:hypothetical protein
MATKPDNRLILGASLQSRDGTLTKDALVTNGYLEKMGERVRTYKRGGLNLVTALGTGLGQGMTNFVTADNSEILYAVNNATFQVANTPNAGGAWSTSASIAANVAAIFSFGGFVWQVGGDTTPTSAYYASTVGGAVTLAATGIFGGVNRSAQAPIVVGQLVYLVGGHQSSNSTLTKAEVWSTADGSNYTQLTSAAAFGAKTFVRIAKIGSTMYYLGGQDSAGTYDNSVYSSTDGITWTLVTTTPSWGGVAAALRTRYAVCSFSGRLWVMGGLVNGVRKNDVWYSSDGNTWTQATASAAWSIRTDPNVFTIAGGAIMALVGGADGGGQIYSVYTTVDGATWTVGTAVTGVTFLSGNNGYGGTHKGFAWVANVASGTGFVFSTSTTTSGTSLGTVTIGAGDMADFSKNLDGTQIMVRVGTAAYKLLTTTQVLSKVTDVDYPTQTVRGNPYLDGVFYVMTPAGKIQGSDDEDCSSWNSANFVTAEFEPDSGVALGKYNNYIVAFGQWTTQMFWDAAIPPPASALAPVQNGVILIGCAHANSVAQIESTMLWIAQRKGQGSAFQKGRFIAMLEGQSYVQISTPDVDRVLDTDDLATVYSCVGSFGGHNFYILSLGTTGVSLVYDMTEKFWYAWTRTTAAAAPKTITALSQVAGIATATSANHGFSDGDPVTISGATQSGYNLTQVNITYVSANTFTYPVAPATVSPATGSPVAAYFTEGYFSVSASCNYQNSQVFQDTTSGNIYSLLDTVFQDNSTPINFKLRTSNQDLGTNKRKFASLLTPMCDMTSSSSTGLLRYTDNDYQTYSTYRRFDLSDVTPSGNRWGNYRRRAWEWRYTQNTRHRIESLEIDQHREK